MWTDVKLKEVHHTLMKIDANLEKIHSYTTFYSGCSSEDEGSEDKDETVVNVKDVRKDAESAGGLAG